MMNFNTGIKSISISSHARKVFEELDTIRPKHISFSLMLAITADEYLKNHKRGLVKLDEFSTEKITSKIPNFMGDIDSWINYISSINGLELNDIRERLLQIQNMVDKRNEHGIY